MLRRLKFTAAQAANKNNWNIDIRLRAFTAAQAANKEYIAIPEP